MGIQWLRTTLWQQATGIDLPCKVTKHVRLSKSDILSYIATHLIEIHLLLFFHQPLPEHISKTNWQSLEEWHIFQQMQRRYRRPKTSQIMLFLNRCCSDTHSEHRFLAPSSKEGCRKPVLGVWLWQSLWLCSAQLLKQQLAKCTSSFKLAGSPPP